MKKILILFSACTDWNYGASECKYQDEEIILIKPGMTDGITNKKNYK